jgi:glycosyltransferase involved in cell wall biosynthesis
VFLLPSESESFGLAALEAMACEVPVISTNAGGLAEVNVHGVTGFLSQVGDVDQMAGFAIQLLENEEVLNRFRRQAYAHARTFDIQHILPKYEHYYEQVMASSKLTALDD